MKKRLNTENIANELRGGSAFFPDYEAGDRGTRVKTTDVADVPQTTSEADSPAIPSPQTTVDRKEVGIVKAPSDVASPERKEGKSNHGTTTPRHHDTKQPWYHDTIKW